MGNKSGDSVFRSISVGELNEAGQFLLNELCS